MRWRLFFLAVVFLPNLLLAEVIPVRSGEHSDFTRLVFTLPSKATKWELRETAEGYELRVQADATSFDLSTVFERVPRTRLASILAKGNVVAMKLACSCKTRAFRFGENSVVVDIIEAEPAALPKEVKPDLKTPEKAVSNTVLQEEDQYALRQQYIGIESFLENGGRVQELEQELMKSVVHAATQGLLKPKSYSKGLADDAIGVHTEAPSLDAPKRPNNSNMRALSSVDEMLNQKLSALQTIPTDSCVPDAQLELSKWSDGRQFSDQIGNFRRELMKEFDKADHSAVLDLARLYIYFTFGAEARRVLALMDGGEEAEMLENLSYVVEGEMKAAKPFFERQRFCLGRVHFWATLAGASPELTEQNSKTVQLQFNALPVHLRDHLGAPLIERFLAEGKTGVSSQLLTVAERTGSANEPALAMARAHIFKAKNELPLAEEILTTVLEDDGPMTPEAVVELIELHEKRYLAPSPDIVDLASAFAVEYRKSELGRDLRRATSVARMLIGQYDEGLAMLSEIEMRDGKDTARGVRDDLFTILLREASDFEIVQAVVPLEPKGPVGLEFGVETVLASRLFHAGFVELAARTLSSSTKSRSGSRQLLKARIALAQGLPKRAEAELLGLQGDEAEMLRGKAKTLSGEHSEAVARYASVNLEEMKVEAAWLAADWDVLVQAEQSKYSDLALLRQERLAQDATQISDTEGRILAQNRALLNSSRQLRSVSAGLLASHPAPANQ